MRPILPRATDTAVRSGHEHSPRGTRAEPPCALRSRTAAEAVAAGRIAGLLVRPGSEESDTPKRLYWRTGVGEGARLEITIEPKPDGKCLVTLTAKKLDSQEQREEARTDLRAILAAIG